MPPEKRIPWNSFPALMCAGCFAAGIVAAHLWAPPLQVWIAALAAALVAAIVALRNSPRLIGLRPLALASCAFVAVTAAGGLRYATYFAASPNNLAFGEASGDVGVVGRIAAPPRGDRLVLEVDSVSDGAIMRPATGKLLVNLPGDAALHSCDVVRLQGTLQPLPRPRNPGDFDYGAFLRRQRIYRTFRASSDARVLATSGGCPVDRLRDAMRSELGTYVRDARSFGVVQALVLGDRSGIARATIEQFAHTGLLHVLAVSGLHVMIVGMILYQLLRPTLMRLGFSWRRVEATRSLITCSVLLVYMLVTGGSPSVVRAVVMTVLFTGAATFQRTTRPLNTLGAAALPILALAPSQLFDPGFQLSFAAVGGIVLLAPRLSLSGIRRLLASGLSVTAAATAGTLPIVLFHFGRVAPGGLLLNLAAIPLTSAVLASGVLVLPAGIVSSPAAAVLGSAAGFLARVLLLVAEEGDRMLGWTSVDLDLHHPAAALAVGLLVLAVAAWRRPRIRWKMAALAALLFAGLFVGRLVEGDWKPRLDVIFLDVGQGDAILLIHPNGRVLLVDAGGRSSFTDSGRRVILPVLEKLGVRRLHTAVITHPDSDHLGGLPTVLRSIRVVRVYQNGAGHSSHLYEETQLLLDSIAVVHRSLHGGDTLEIDPSVRIFAVYPPRLDPSADANDNSLVLEVRYGATSFLLMGDAPAHAEEEIMRSYAEVAGASVLKVGHHGSETSSSANFIAWLRARGASSAIISVAKSNRYGLPDPDVVSRLRSAGLETLLTADAGAVWMRSDGAHISRVDWRRNQW